MMTYYTIQTPTSEGTYYLVNHWNKHKAFWKTINKYHKDMMFTREQDAKRSLNRLLEVMGEYRFDEDEDGNVTFAEFYMMEVRYSDWRDGFVFYPMYRVGV